MDFNLIELDKCITTHGGEEDIVICPVCGCELGENDDCSFCMERSNFAS